MNRVSKVASTNISSLVKISESLGDAASNSNTSRYDAAACLVKKASIDSEIVYNLDKLAADAATAAATPAQYLPSLGGAFGKSLLMGTGLALPIVAGGVYLLNKYKEKADDTVASTLDRLPGTIAEVISAGRHAAIAPRSRNYAEFQGAYSLNLKLRSILDSGVKTAAEADYRKEMLDRSNAHVAHLLTDLI